MSRWNETSIGALSVDELKQLRDNALRLGSEAVVALCDDALAAGNAAAGGAATLRRAKSTLVPRRSAFAMRGVQLNAGMSSWGGVRQSDGVVVFSLWADDVRSEKGGCSYLLWAPNTDGTRPWFDLPGGKERLAHCKLAIEKGGAAEGFLVHGVRIEGTMPEQRARSVEGADPGIVIRFQVVQRGEEYWAVWGRT